MPIRWDRGTGGGQLRKWKWYENQNVKVRKQTVHTIQWSTCHLKMWKGGANDGQLKSESDLESESKITGFAYNGQLVIKKVI